MNEAPAFLICVMDAPPKYPGDKVIVIICPFCRACHKHRGAQISVRQARCDETKAYRVTIWGRP